MDQITLFSSGPDAAISALRPALENTLEKNFLSHCFLHIAERKGYFSISFNDMLFIRIPKLKTKKRIEIVDSPDVVRKIELNDWVDATAHEAECVAALEKTINSVPKDFSCCSRYKECSDARACIHPDQSMRLGCYYRRVLASGKVFYGKEQIL